MTRRICGAGGMDPIVRHSISLTALIGLILSGTVAWAENASVPLNALSASASYFEAKARGGAVLPAAEIAKLRSQLADLTALYGTPDASVPPAYTRALEGDARLLRQAQTMDDAAAGRIIKGVASDIEIKRNFALSANALGGAPPTTVSVTVQIKQFGQPVSGYIVRWAPELWSDDVVYEFNGDPLKGDITPGRYIVTALRNATVATRQPKPVGLSGHSTETIDIVVP